MGVWVVGGKYLVCMKLLQVAMSVCLRAKLERICRYMKFSSISRWFFAEKTKCNMVRAKSCDNTLEEAHGKVKIEDVVKFRRVFAASADVLLLLVFGKGIFRGDWSMGDLFGARFVRGMTRQSNRGSNARV